MEYRIGKVIKTHGVRGEVVVEPTTDDVDKRYIVGAVLRGSAGGGNERDLTIETLRAHKGRLLVKFEEIPDRTAGDALRGMQFFAEPLEHNPEEDGFYDHELEGLDVLHDGVVIGEVSGVIHGPASTLLSVNLLNGKEDVLIPFVDAIVPEVDLEAGALSITPPEGLLDL